MNTLFDKDVALPSARTTGEFLGKSREALDALAAKHRLPLLSKFVALDWHDPALGATALRALSAAVAAGEGDFERRALLLGELADLIARLESAASQGARFRFEVANKDVDVT